MLFSRLFSCSCSLVCIPQVRDRAAILLRAFDTYTEEPDLRHLLDEPMPMSFAALERSIKAFMAHPAQQHGVSDDKPLVFTALPIIEEAYVPPPASVARAGGVHKKSTAETSSSSSGAVDQAALDPAAAVYKIPEFSGLGVAFRSTTETALTETEMEYVVTCVKHVFEKHVVLQFSVLNTIDDQRLKDVRVNVDVADSEGYTVETTVPAAIARYGEKAHCFVCLSRNGDPATSTINCELHFKVVQVDPATGEVTTTHSVNTPY